MKKGTAGFTLVELIVVIAILGILAGIAIPVYSGYISKANEAADYQVLDAIKTAAVFAAVDNNNDFGAATGITVTASSGSISKITITDGTNTFATDTNTNFAAEVKTLLGVKDDAGTYGTLKAFTSGANWSSTATGNGWGTN